MAARKKAEKEKTGGEEEAKKSYAISESELEELLSPKNKIDLELEKKLGEMKAGFTALAIVEPQNYTESRMGLLRRFVKKKKMAGVFVTVNKPFEKLLQEIRAEGIDADKVRFVDMISNTTGSEKEGLKGGAGVDFLESTGDLTELIMVCEKRLNGIKGEKFIVLDSVSALLVYNQTEAVEKFIHALANKISKAAAFGVIIIIESRQFEGAIQTLSQFCDGVVKVGDERGIVGI